MENKYQNNIIMKRKTSFFWMLSILMVFAIAMTNCTKEGPAGPAGADGVDGVDGTDGTDGVDGNSTCLVCHTQANMDAIAASYAATNHASGTSFAYAGGRDDCAYCHSNDGFVEFARSGQKITPAVATSLSCKACHNSHVSLEEGIGAPLYYFESVASLTAEGAAYNYEGGNLCATCHQARRGPDSYYKDVDLTYNVKFTGDDIALYQAHGAIGPNGTMELIGDTLFVTFDVPAATHTYTNNTHAGPHHGPQANIIAADIGSVAGVAYERHIDCSGCHLGNSEAGSGHTFVPDINACDECHGDAVDVSGEMQAVAERLAAIEMALENIGAIHVAEDGIHPMIASLPTDQWNAFWNFMCLYEDNSHGIHNIVYAKQLLNQAEAALGL